MTLLTAVLAAVTCTVIWYRNAPHDTMKVSVLCWMYWGASIMWLVDAIHEYAEVGSSFFTPAPADLLDDLVLGLSVVTLGLVIWLVILLVADPRGVVRAALTGSDQASDAPHRPSS